MAAGLLGTTDRSQREVVVYTHTRPDTAMVEVENTRTTVTPEQLRIWCQQAGTKITVRPVLDLNDEITTSSYEPTDRQKEQAWLIHPDLRVPALHPTESRGKDTDHITEWPIGASTVVELRAAVPRPPPVQDAQRLDLHPDRTQGPSPGPARWAAPTTSSPTDIPADPHPADHGRRGNSHVAIMVAHGLRLVRSRR